MKSFLRTMVTLAVLMAGVFVVTQHLAKQQPTLPDIYPTARAENPRSLQRHDPQDEALKKYGLWQAERRDHRGDEFQAFHNFKNYWEGFLTAQDKQGAILKIYKRPEGVIPAAGSEAVAFKSKNIYDQFQEFLDQSYPEQKAGN